MSQNETENGGARRSRASRSRLGNKNYLLEEEEVAMPNVNSLKSIFQMNQSGGAYRGRKVTSSEPRHTQQVPLEQSVTNSNNSADDEVDIDNINHTQRFRVTRALFAKMEEQNKRDRLNADNRHLHRSKSPTRYPGTHTRLALSPMNSNAEVISAPSQSTEHKLMKASEKLKYTMNERKAKGGLNEARLGGEGEQMRGNGQSVRDNVLEDVPSPKWLMQHYEKATKTSSSSSSDGKKPQDLPSTNLENTRSRLNKSSTSVRARGQESWSASSTPTQEQPPFLFNGASENTSSWKRTISDSNISSQMDKTNRITPADTRFSSSSNNNQFPSHGDSGRQGRGEEEGLLNGDNISEKLAEWKSRRRSNNDNSSPTSNITNNPDFSNSRLPGQNKSTSGNNEETFETKEVVHELNEKEAADVKNALKGKMKNGGMDKGADRLKEGARKEAVVDEKEFEGEHDEPHIFASDEVELVHRE